MQRNKIGILTFYYNNTNYGGQCQSYALQKALNNLGFDTEQICYRTTLHNLRYNVSRKDKIKKLLKNPSEVFTNRVITPRIKKQLKKRLDNFDEFKKSIPHSNIVYEDETIRKANAEYSAFVCGSDQIWKDWGSNSEIEKRNYILGFVTPNKTALSYAASLGVNEISDSYQKLLSEELKKFRAISVREKSAIELLKPLTEKDVVEVVDPVLLVSAKEWTECAVEPTLDENYIFCYFLSDNKAFRNFARKVAKATKWKLVTIPYAAHHSFNKSDLNFGQIRDLEAGPREFIGYIKNAKLVLTDSFHAMVFSTIFHRNFYVFRRDSENQKVTMNNRISDFLDNFGIKDRLISDKSQVSFEDVDYTEYDKILKEKKQFSLNYLLNNLNNCK